MLDFEHELLSRLGIECSQAEARQRLNFYFLSEEGFSELVAMHMSGLYEIVVPEEGALMVAAWLVDAGHRDEAREIIDQLIPFFLGSAFLSASIEGRCGQRFASLLAQRRSGHEGLPAD